jgi:hypothetical protein
MHGGEESNQMNLGSKKQYAKIAAIPLLSLVLYAVFPRTESRQDSTTHEKSNAQSSSGDHRSRNRLPSSTTSLGKEKRTEWPNFSLSDISTIDPFDKGMIFPENAVSTTKESSSDSPQQKLVSSPLLSHQATKVSDVKIQAIFRSSRGIAALVDTRLIHVGDQLSDGTEVVEITPEKLIVVVPNVE